MLHTDNCPVLEYDDDRHDLIGDGEAKRIEVDRFPTRAIFAFLGEVVDQYAEREQLEIIDRIEMIGDVYPVYRAFVGGESVALMRMPLGSPAAVMCTDYLFRFGVKRAIAVGSCGGLKSFAEGELIVPKKALRDEGTSYKYEAPSRWIQLDEAIREAIIDAVIEAGHKTIDDAVWTNDAFYRETPAIIRHRCEEGCGIVDMECSAMAASAHLRGAQFAQLFFTADSLAEPDGHDARDWGYSQRGQALEIALLAIARVEK